MGITVDAAFEVLRRYARSHQLAMRDVSRRVVDGDLQLPKPKPNLNTAVCGSCGDPRPSPVTGRRQVPAAGVARAGAEPVSEG